MKKRNRLTILFICLFISSCGFHLVAQDEWQVPGSMDEKRSIITFDEEVQKDGEKIFSASCVSCHGNPTKSNFTPMAPPPGDIADASFQDQLDGHLYYKIEKGRGSMPAFENTFSQNEIWSLVAYIRSFNSSYVQKFPDMAGIEIPQLSITLDYDVNVDKLVAKVVKDSATIVLGASVKAYVKGMFGNHMLGKTTTNEYGISYFDIDANIPGDEDGNVRVVVKATKGYGTVTVEEYVAAGKPMVKKSATAGRHLWSVAKKAPIWMIIAFNIIGIGVWVVILYVIIGLRKIKKLQ